MYSIRQLLVVTALVASAYKTQAELKSLPDNYRNAYLSGSVPTIKEEIAIDNDRLQIAYDAYVVVNASCHEIAAVSSAACGECIGAKCKERYNAVCPPPKPTVEPGCEEIKANSSYYCLYYVDENICSECATDGNRTLCGDCALEKCKARYINTCPLDRPTTAPSCGQLQSNSSYYCLYYAIPEKCGACTDLTSQSCKDCIKSKCENRGKDQCGNFITDTILFFSEDVPFFFETTVPDSFEFLGTEIADFSQLSFNSVIGFGTDVGGGIDIFFTDLVPEIGTEIGEGISDFFVDDIPTGIGAIGDINVDFDIVLDPIGDTFENFGTAVFDDLLEPIGKGFEEFGNIFVDLGDIFSGGFDFDLDFGLWKRKKRSASLKNLLQRRRRSVSEPGCEAIKADPNTACLFYNDALICDDCGFDPDIQCPGWTTTVADLQYAIDQRKWMEAQKTDGSYTITSVKYDTNKATLESYTYTDLDVELKLFGRELKFIIPEALNLRNATQTGEAIGKMAVELSRADALSG